MSENPLSASTNIKGEKQTNEMRIHAKQKMKNKFCSKEKKIHKIRRSFVKYFETSLSKKTTKTSLSLVGPSSAQI